jgi:hypothetical protein
MYLRLPTLASLVVIAGCDLAQPPQVNTAELLVETQEVVQGVRDELVTFQDQIDSLRTELARQDSLIRILANLQGIPLPQRPAGAILP